MIEYLANYTGNKFVRINNHEHTDLQEYLGTYISDSEGKLRFQEGLLVQAMREGSWIVLDELNLAPTDVLEALNRLLDDNRELLIPETQEIVRPSENFCLFATQNPPGLYGGRKMLSRAFRNRFLELHFDDIPENELETILQKRSRNTAPSDCRRIVSVYKQLTRLRQESRVFEQKNSFATLRDLFRWALRGAETRQEIAENGFMLLAERVRKQEEREEVKKVIEEVFKVTINPNLLYDRDVTPEFGLATNSQGVIWTKAMRRLYVLVKHAIQNNEPVLLVGETGCGKTTVCQLLAEFKKQTLHIVNAHQNTETGDLIGSQRPVRNRGAILDALFQDLKEAAGLLEYTAESVEELQAWYRSLTPADLAKLPEPLKAKIKSATGKSKALFEWSDGSLVHAMKEGSYFLLDEISLADDSVLERLNSVLEPHRSILLAEKGVDDSFIRAVEGFQFFATMNPGGDFGKRELSPALRNRFTEIWVPSLSEEDDVHDIIVSKLDARYQVQGSGNSRPVSRVIVEFSSWFGKTFRPSSATAFSVRDILAWVHFMNTCQFSSAELALLHGAAMVFIDTIGANPSALISVDPRTMEAQRHLCLEKLSELSGCDLLPKYMEVPQIQMDQHRLSIGEFSIARSVPEDAVDAGDEFGVPTTKMNAMRVIRALQGTKPILLEGNPGVGKTTLVMALARACGKPLTRINLSDQTDLMDLFGTDVPVEGAEAGNFAWQNAPFLEAMQNGSWVLLDEMNLASQTVLEGLNACLDHRGEVYIAELDQVFKRHPDFKLFAAQNPHSQGGGRKGLPSSFVNRFIVVYSDVFTKEDLMHITAKKFDKIGEKTQRQLIEFIARLDNDVVTDRAFGSQGSPWEFNLRDTLRWGNLLTSQDALLAGRKPDDFLDVIIRQRFRTERDRQEVNKLFANVFERAPEGHGLYHDINPHHSQVGLASIQRNTMSQPTPFPSIDPVPRLPEIESILIAIEQDLPCILVGSSGSGKSSLLDHVAALAGKPLVIFPLNADVDTMDLIGGFEQADPHREVLACLSKVQHALQEEILRTVPNTICDAAVDLMGVLKSLTGDEQHYAGILKMIEDLQDEAVSDDLAALLSEAADLLCKPLTIENPRFEWLDGVIVRAVQSGAWLVLDNANLCSASVLDRLNSLLERPNGTLSINEHSGPGGQPRIVETHPDFRIFLTVDPRYGELSRAMRNRSVEIYLDGTPPRTASMDQIAPVDGGLQRYHTATRILNESAEDDTLVPLAFDMLSLNDTKNLKGFMQTTGDNLQGASSFSLLRSLAAHQRLGQLVSYTESEDAAPLRQALSSLYSSSPDKKLLMLMPLHPLINSPMIPVVEQGREGLAAWLASCYEFYLDIGSSQTAMEAQLVKVNLSKPSLMNRLQRSWVADKVASLSRDSTVNAGRFLLSVLREVKAYLIQHVDEAGAWKERRSVLRRLMLFWKRTFESLITTTFEEARFQAHLTQGSNLLQHSLSALQDSGDRKMLSTLFQCLERDFVVGFKLSTGLSMEILWNKLRPDPIPDLKALEQVVEMERLADRFDALRWRADTSISTLRTVQDAMTRAYSFVRIGKGDASGLVKELETEISTLESGIGQHPGSHQPFFAASFEALRQTLVLHQVSQNSTVLPGSSDVVVLSNMPTTALMRLQSPKKTTLQLVDYILAQNSEVHPWAGTMSRSLLLKYDASTSASLQELRSLEVEMPIMGKALAQASEALATNPLAKTERLLLGLMEEVLCAHGESCKGRVLPLYEELLNGLDFSAVEIGGVASWLEQGVLSAPLQSDWPAHLIELFRKHFYKALMALAAAEKGLRPRSAYTSIAWVQFSLACVKLFVPDKIFDPHHRAQIELEEHREMYESLQKQITALEAFELAFTGQKTSLRSKLLTEEVEGLGEPPSVQAIYRPGGAELRGLQGEFNNVLNALVQSDVSVSHLRSISTLSTEATEEMALVEQNLVALIGRFSGRFNAYQDLTMPLVSFLRCLQMGLSVGQGSVASILQNEGDSMSLVAITPFLNGTAWRANTTSLPLNTLEFLSFVQAVAAVEGLKNIPAYLRRSLHDSLASFHESWSKKLDADRREEEERTNLFKFKGSLEDEQEFDQEEFDQLFPDYAAPEDEDAPKKKVVQRGNRDLSVLVAEAHEKIFLTLQDPQLSIRGLCTQVARKFAREKRNTLVGEPELDAQLLPATMLVFEEQQKAFHSNVDSANYNFYTDANLIEVRKLLTLVNSIKKRFQDLQMVDEIGHHQTLADVVMACGKVLEMSINDPLAALIAPVERLHSFVYEWQEGGWAAQVHKATILYDRLRDTICDWRRLELSSWSRLLEMEAKKCHDAAKSWWFIAYASVILEPCERLRLGEDLKDYSVSLLGTLEKYFQDANLGQFAPRLNLLRQLKSQLDILMLDVPALVTIRDAVQNFIAYYSRYERKIADSIAASRAPLDRSMKDVLLLSKWRDKNIDALRDSAKRSHQKLFRLVRKFRFALGQPINAIIAQGLPEEDHTKNAFSQVLAVSEAKADKDAIALCRQLVPGIDDHPQWGRLSNVSTVLKAMSKHGSLPASEVDFSGTVDEYLTDLVSSMVELKKETPGLLTDENKALVKHLKTRKTVLYSDTLKMLRAMGFSRSIGTTSLRRQETTQQVLVGSGLVPYLSGSSLAAIEYFYHKTLDLAPRFRLTANEHSEELSRDVIHRSIGYLEGILYVMFRQRQYLSRATQAERSLDQCITFVKELSASNGRAVESKKSLTNYLRVTPWLIQILKAGIHLAGVHGKLGHSDNADICTKLGGWVEIFTALAAAQAKLPQLPAGFGSPAHDQLQVDVERELAALREDLDTLLVARPDMAFVIHQIQLWASTEIVGVASQVHHKTINEFAESVMTLTSKILVALQSFQKASQNLPLTTEEATWFVSYSSGLEKSIDALRMPKIVEEIEQVIQLSKSAGASQPDAVLPATALLRAVLPVVEQYAFSCQQNIGQYGEVHRTACRLGYTLSNSFVQIAAQGFCSPQEKNEKSGESGKVESGTGLGDGQGADDISKDIEPDEDLSDLAQEPNAEKNEDMENQKDAIDMGEDDMEGDMGSVAGDDEEEEDGSEGEDGDDDIENEEAGDVDDLDPTAVDEKMWDGSGEDDAEKDQKGDKAAGQKDEEQTAADEPDNKQQQEDDQKDKGPEEGAEKGEEDDAEAEAGQEAEGAPQEELNHQDQNVQENDTLALPEDMNIDLDDDESVTDDGDNLDGLSDAEKEEEGEVDDDAPENKSDDGRPEDGRDEGTPEIGSDNEEEANAAGEEEAEDMDVDENEEEKEDEGEDAEAPEDKDKPSALPEDQAVSDQDNAAPSDVRTGGGQAEDDGDNMQDETAENQSAQKEQGALAQQAAEQDSAPGEKGAASRSDQEQGPSGEQENDAQDSQPFKKLGDALERWYNTQKDIRSADDKQEDITQTPADDMARMEFQHLQDENAEADTQALGTATDEELRPVDDAMAIDTEMEDNGNQILPDMDEEDVDKMQDVDMDDAANPAETQDDAPKTERDETRSGVATRQGAPDGDETRPQPDASDDDESDDEEKIDETSTQLSTTHITDPASSLRDFSEALDMWVSFQTKTHPLSLSLSSQLRLILTPSQSTKLSGSFRTGKRLNIKKIIPYIASSYKRDKIWMRRSVPSKRAYQILLCVDDSSSMGENDNASGPLALESLVMMARALTMLEVGQVGVLSFGTDVSVAHALTEPFASHDAGARVLQHFTFKQQGTDMVRLLRSTIDHFREARFTAPGGASSGEDLWQLALILSDGLVQSKDHARLRPLLREAMEQRVMVVFIVIDDAKGNGKKGHSVLELKEARFGADGVPVINRYLDSFPFPYYLIVHHLDDLPGALAALLRTWFAEVNA
ncbi:hypothetical protein B0T19DRAFT_415687 [Cercophora scortea]|uniref:Midasin n=1 Tax=Cercophora scortea TaxID=314031 RepID=A0AAE0IWX0_9PEZI|nr:hypothetical protein B0T19DRAFT_415687 [Cercophora scortea]